VKQLHHRKTNLIVGTACCITEITFESTYIMGLRQSSAIVVVAAAHVALLEQ
jgi:hypothetical protein